MQHQEHQEGGETDKILAAKLPELPPAFLKYYNAKMKVFKQDRHNKGNVEVCTHWRDGRPLYTDISQRDKYMA
jgi:hypothetical protein